MTELQQATATDVDLPDRVRPPGRRALIAEHAAVLLLAALVLVVHDLGYLLHQPFWYDEAWVAVTTRSPVSELPATTYLAPVGFSLLLRPLVPLGEQAARLLPLAFAGGAVMVAYWFARGLGWYRQTAAIMAGVLAGAAALLVPAMLVRDDLKQYTADACLALLVLLLTSRLEREWSRRRLAALSVAVWGGMLFCEASAFAGAAAFTALCLIQLTRRQWRQLAETAGVGAVTAVLMLGVYEAFDARGVGAGLYSYWSNYFLPISHGLSNNVGLLDKLFTDLGGYFGLGPAWIASPLVLTGVVTLFRLGRPVIATAVILLWPEMLVLAVDSKYPFIDVRTSTFLYTITAVVAAIGVAGICAVLLPRLRGALAVALAAVAIAAFTGQARPYIRSRLIPTEDVRDQARYAAVHAASGDVILVNEDSNSGFTYYWPYDVPLLRVHLPIVVAQTRDQPAITAALSDALARQHGCGRIWLIRTHQVTAEEQAWATAIRQKNLTAVPVGNVGLTEIKAGGSACS